MQVYHAMAVTGERVSNIVVMGTGEPMDNFDNLLKFIELITSEDGYNLSERGITVSSCGIVPKIKDCRAIFRLFDVNYDLFRKK